MKQLSLQAFLPLSKITRCLKMLEVLSVDRCLTNIDRYSQGWRQGRTRGGYSPLSEHASPPSEGGKLFCRRFLAFTIP